MKTLVSILLFACLTIAHAQEEHYVRIPQNIDPSIIKKIEGTYENTLGYKTIVKLKALDPQGDLFTGYHWGVSFSEHFGFFASTGGEDFSIDKNSISFKTLEEDGDVVFYIDEDVDYSPAIESYGDIAFKKKMDGTYYLVLSLTSHYQDFGEGAEIALEIGPQNYCKKLFPPIVSHNIEVLEHIVGPPFHKSRILCEAKVTILLSKNN